MKKPLNFLVPVLLILVILLIAGWYFLKFDTALTRDIFLSQARKAADSGNYSRAIRLYEAACRYDKDSAEAAIALSQQYQAEGNYTKAESTLVQTIRRNPSVALYTALSKTYVAQDKLLDASRLLDRITDPTLYEKMQELRPDTVAASLPSGIYNENLNPTFSCPNGKIYLTYMTGQSSMADQTANIPQSLTSGDHLLSAMAVNKDGLVSSLAIYHYTITGVVEEVFFADPVLEDIVRRHLGLSESAILMSDMLWEITELTIPSTVSLLDDLTWLPGLKKLTADGASLGNSNLWLQLPRLESVSLQNIEFSNLQLTAIAQLPNLRELTLKHCNISNISPLKDGAALTHLDLSGNLISDISPLLSLSGLNVLNLSGNALSSLPEGINRMNLQYLDLSYNALSSLEQLDHFSTLEEICVDYNSQISSLQPLVGCSSLTSISAVGTSVTSIDDGFDPSRTTIVLQPD